jgi:hypothetical protein
VRACTQQHIYYYDLMIRANAVAEITLRFYSSRIHHTPSTHPGSRHPAPPPRPRPAQCLGWNDRYETAVAKRWRARPGAGASLLSICWGISGDCNGVVRRWDLLRGRCTHQLQAHCGAVRSLLLTCVPTSRSGASIYPDQSQCSD